MERPHKSVDVEGRTRKLTYGLSVFDHSNEIGQELVLYEQQKRFRGCLRRDGEPAL